MKKLFIIFGLFITVSCHQLIEVELPPIKPRPVVNCWLNDNGSYNFNLSLTREVTTDTTLVIESAKVFIEAENQIFILPHKKKGFYYNPEFSPVSNVPYKLRVEIDGYLPLYSVDSIPSFSLKVNETKFFENFMKDGEGDEYSEIWINLTDIHKGHDYYGISVQGKSENRVYSLMISSSSPEIMNETAFEIYPEMLVFTDELFQNKSTTLKIRTYMEGANYVKLYRLSEQAYKYIKSWNIHDYTQDYDFWEVYEPQPLYSNIENGYGIFAGYSQQVFEVYPDSTITFQ